MERPLVTGVQMQAIERREIDRGLTGLALMEVAARAIADAAEVRFEPNIHREIVALAGPGNNGGDAVAAARLLRDRGFPVRALLAAGAPRAGTDLAHQVALHGDVRTASADDVLAAIDRDVLVIDGLFGTGLTRALDGDPARVVAALGTPRPGRTVIAVDIPSGIDAGSGQVLGAAVRADLTVTFQVPKLGHFLHPGRAHRGELCVVDIGLPMRAFEAADGRVQLLGDDVIDAAFPDRAPAAHKGLYGHLVVVAGHPDRPGSALLAGHSALRSGAGLVTLAAEREVIARVAGALGELMGHEAGIGSLDAERVLSLLEDGRKSALVIGPSLGTPDDTAIRTILHMAHVPVVADAGALHTIAADPAVIRARTSPTVLTPHPGEMSALTGKGVAELERDRLGEARALAQRLGAIVVLKGASTVVAAPDGRLAVSPTGNPGMATGGTGDVLAGLIGGLLAQRLDPWLAATAGVYLHGKAGDRAREQVGEPSLVASDVMAQLGPTIVSVRATAAPLPWSRGRWPSTTRGHHGPAGATVEP